jgi:hypothetical protein
MRFVKRGLFAQQQPVVFNCTSCRKELARGCQAQLRPLPLCTWAPGSDEISRVVRWSCCQNLLSWIAPGIWVAHGLTNLDTIGVFPAQNHSNNSEPNYHLGAAGIPKHLTPNLRSSAETGAHSWNCKICLAKLCSAAGSLRCSGRTPGGTHKATKWAHQII